jgi:hypothetical protein
MAKAVAKIITNKKNEIKVLNTFERNIFCKPSSLTRGFGEMFVCSGKLEVSVGILVVILYCIIPSADCSFNKVLLNWKYHALCRRKQVFEKRACHVFGL